MKKIISGLLATVLAVSAAQAETYANKTYFAEQPELSYRSMDMVGHMGASCSSKEGGFGARVHLTGFYAQSEDNANMTKYFGNATKGFEVKDRPAADTSVKKSWSVTTDVNIGRKLDESSGDDAEAQRYLQLAGAFDPTNGLYGQHVDHAPETFLSGGGDIMAGTVAFTPKRSEWGARLSWDQDLSSLLDGLSLSVCAPIVSVTHEAKAVELDGAQEATYEAADKRTNGSTPINYFVTGMNEASAFNTQDALAKAKLSTKGLTASGVADVNVGLNWRVMHKSRWDVSLGAHAVIPTGNSSTGEYLYEPIYGNNGHWALGGTLAASAKVWNSNRVKLRANVAANYQYVFEAKEIRTMGLKASGTGVVLPGSQYNLLMQDRKAGVFPAANILTQSLKVTPGHQYGGTAGICVDWKGFTFDVGYNLAIRDAEVVKVDAQWQDDQYAVASPWFKKAASPIADELDEHENRIGGLNGETVVAKEGVSGKGVTGVAASFDERAYGIATKGTAIDGMSVHNAVSVGGPIQHASATSTLADRKRGASVDTANGTLATKQASAFNIAPEAAATPYQTTHAISGGVGYKIEGDVPVMLSLGGEYKFADVEARDRTGWAAWGKVGVRF